MNLGFFTPYTSVHVFALNQILFSLEEKNGENVSGFTGGQFGVGILHLI